MTSHKKPVSPMAQHIADTIYEAGRKRAGFMATKTGQLSFAEWVQRQLDRYDEGVGKQ
jgi:hypothetical protein